MANPLDVLRPALEMGQKAKKAVKDNVELAAYTAKEIGGEMVKKVREKTDDYNPIVLKERERVKNEARLKAQREKEKRLREGRL